mgnify:CR=1 FL=1
MKRGHLAADHAARGPLPGSLIADDRRAVAVDPPMFVELTVAETDPMAKGATISASPKPATLETGLVIQVPSFITAGEAVVVQTADGQYLSRAKE